MTKHLVGAANGWAEGECRLVRVEGVEIGIFLVGGEHRAYRNFCPHAGAPLCVIRAGGAEPDSAAYERGREPASLRCPWHGWEFDLRTGAFVGNPRCALDGYRVEVAEGAVCVWA